MKNERRLKRRCRNAAEKAMRNGKSKAVRMREFTGRSIMGDFATEKWESEMIASLAEIMVRHNLTAHDMLTFMTNASCFWTDKLKEPKPPTMKLV